MESNESSNMTAATNSPIDIVQSLMQDQGYLQEAFESTYESMDFLNRPESASSAVAKEESSKTYAPEEFLNEPGVSQAANKNNDSTQSEFERLLNEDIVDDTDDIVADLSTEAVTFLDKATEEFDLVSKTVSDKDVVKPNEKVNDDSSNESKLGLEDATADKPEENINQDTSQGLDLGLNDAVKKIEETINQDTSKDISLGVNVASDVGKIDEKIDQVASEDLRLGVSTASNAVVTVAESNTLSVTKVNEKDLVVKVAESNTLSVPKIIEEGSEQITKEKADTYSQSTKEDEEISDSLIQREKNSPHQSSPKKLPDLNQITKEKEDTDSQSIKDVETSNSSIQIESVALIISSPKKIQKDTPVSKITEEDSDQITKERLNTDSQSLIDEATPNNLIQIESVAQIHSSPKKTQKDTPVSKITEGDSVQTTKEKVNTDVQSTKEDEEIYDSLIQIESVAPIHSSPKKMQVASPSKEPDKTKVICTSSADAEIVTTESLEAMLESLDGPAAPDLMESEGSTNSISVGNAFTRESLQELMEQDDLLISPVKRRSAPVNVDDAVSDATLEDTYSCLDMNIKEELESENEVSFTETFCERSCLIDQDADRHNFKMFECKVLSIDLHDIIKSESARDAKAGLYKPSERKCIDIIRKEFKTKAMQDYIRRAKRMKLPEEKTTRRSNLSLLSSPARKIINQTGKTLSKTTPTTAKSAVGHRTPVQASKKSLTKSSNKTPAQTTKTTPAQSSNKTPARGSKRTPVQISKQTPSGRSSVKTPSRSSFKTPSVQNTVETPSSRRAVKTPSRFSEENKSKNINKTPSLGSHKTPTRSSIRNQTETIGKTTVGNKTLRKRTHSEMQTPKRLRTKQEDEISPQASKKVRLSPDRKKIAVSSKKKKVKDNVSFETATKLLTIDLQDIMKMSKYNNLLKDAKADFSKAKGHNVKRGGLYRKPIRGKESKKASIKMPLQERSKRKAPVTHKSPPKPKVELELKSLPKRNTPKITLDSTSTRPSTRKKPLTKEVQSVKRLRPKRDAEGKFLKKKQNYNDDIYDDDVYDEDYQPSAAEANYTCFDCMEDFETNAELKMHTRFEHDNKFTADSPRKTPVNAKKTLVNQRKTPVNQRKTPVNPRKAPIKTASNKNKSTVPVYFKSDQFRIDRNVGKKSMRDFRPAIDALNKEDMIQGANMVNHHISFYNHELGKNVTDQEIYQHMMKKYTIKSAQLCIGSNRFRSYYQLANSPDPSHDTKISTIKEERGHVLITSPLLHW